MKAKPALWILSVLLCELAWPASAQIALHNGPVGPTRAEGATSDTSIARQRPSPAGLTFVERVAYQRIIEEVYWRHRIWPKKHRAAKPALAQVMSEAVLRAKVEDYLRKSQALAVYGQQPLRGAQLQAEMERMARQTQQPERLRELWAALGNDPYVIAECLARPALVDRLIRTWYAAADVEQFHARRILAPSGEPASMGTGDGRKEGFAAGWARVQGTRRSAVDEPRSRYRLPAITGGTSDCKDGTWMAIGPRYLSARNSHTTIWTGMEMLVWGGMAVTACSTPGAGTIRRPTPG